MTTKLPRATSGLAGLACIAALQLLLGGTAYAAGNPTAGADLFDQECADCHSVKPGKNKKGPSLAGIIGRKSASIGEFSGYSEALKASGLTWTPDNLNSYVKAPKGLVAGGKMKYDGLADDKARADLLAYLASLH
jgi:cytochrome c